MTGSTIAVLTILLAAAPPPAVPAPTASPRAASAPFDAAGFRNGAYRAPVPAPPSGVPRIDAAATARLVDRGGAILIDVMPAEGGRRMPDGSWRLARPHDSLPGAHWFPEAGRAPIDPAIERWFLAGVDRLARAHPRRPLIVYCLADCWMSWNAARRLARAGRRNLYWFAEGGDGWRDLGRPLVPARPEPAD